MIESTHSWIEQIAYQMDNGVSQRRLGSLTALAKVQATQTMGIYNMTCKHSIILFCVPVLKKTEVKFFTCYTIEYCAREACQILGGNSYIRGGIGDKVERIYREVITLQ